MSNVKKVNIVGNLNVMAVMELAGEVGEWVRDMAVNAHNIPAEKVEEANSAAKVLVSFMANTVVPYFGLRMTISENLSVGGCCNKNKIGGLVMYLPYTISGSEAVSYGHLDQLKAALEVFGKVEEYLVSDAEG